MLADVSPGWGIASSVIAAASGLGGIGIGAWMTGRSQKRERIHSRMREQLEQFYSPMIGMRSEIKAKSELRVRLHAVADARWQKLFEGVNDPTRKKAIHDENWPMFEGIVEYSERQRREDLIPLYRNMLSHFSNHMWLAETSTLKHYAALTDFVELWNRFLSNTNLAKVLDALEHSEGKLQPLYQDIETHFDRLREALGN